jgi:integrase
MKKKQFAEGERSIFDDAIIQKRNGYWHFRMWLPKERKYARVSLKTRNEATAIDKGKRAYIELQSNIQQGKTYFSINLKDGVALYLSDREKDVESGLIVKGRYGTIKVHLQHWMDYLGQDEKLKDLHRQSCEHYFHWRTKESASPASPSTIINEQSTINACMKFLFNRGEVHVDVFDFKKLPKAVINNEEIRRATFTDGEYERIRRALKTYCAKSDKSIDADTRMERSIMRCYFMFAANSGMRVGELRQLRWSDVIGLERKTVRGDENVLAHISVRAATSKVRKSRTFLCRGGRYIEQLKDLYGERNKDGLVFTLDGEKEIRERVILSHFYKVMELANIESVESRGIVPYSLRHYCITQRIRSGVGLKQVADMCGTSIAQIERTYYHISDETRLTTATADHKVLDDGTIHVF